MVLGAGQSRRGDGAPHHWPLWGAAACFPRFLLTCTVLMTPSHPKVRGVCERERFHPTGCALFGTKHHAAIWRHLRSRDVGWRRHCRHQTAVAQWPKVSVGRGLLLRMIKGGIMQCNVTTLPNRLEVRAHVARFLRVINRPNGRRGNRHPRRAATHNNNGTNPHRGSKSACAKIHGGLAPPQ